MSLHEGHDFIKFRTGHFSLGNENLCSWELMQGNIIHRLNFRVIVSNMYSLHGSEHCVTTVEARGEGVNNE